MSTKLLNTKEIWVYLQRLTFLTLNITCQRGRLVILPLNTEGDRDTDEDSEDENELHLKNLNKSNLLAGASFDLSISSDNIGLGAGDKEDVAGPSVDVPSKGNKR